MIPCPHCSKKIDPDKIDWEFHKLGRVGICPECKKKLYKTKESRAHVLGPEKGQLVRRFRKR